MHSFALAVALLCQDSLTAEEYEKLFAELRPRATQKWQTVPWRIDLLAARDAAAKSGRPLFMWSMNGHPLGCG